MKFKKDLELAETTAATPPTGHVALFAKTDKSLYIKDDTGLETRQVTVQTASLSSAQAVAGTTLANVTGLSIPVVAGLYRVEIFGRRKHNAAVTFGFGFSGPTVSIMNLAWFTETTIGSPETFGPPMAALATLYNVTDVGTGTADRHFAIIGYVKFSASGTFQLQAARASGTTTEINSATMIMERIAA